MAAWFEPSSKGVSVSALYPCFDASIFPCQIYIAHPTDTAPSLHLMNMQLYPLDTMLLKKSTKAHGLPHCGMIQGIRVCVRLGSVPPLILVNPYHP